MRLLLKDFQIDAVDRLVTRMRSAAREARTGELQAVSLASPTGSGKTVIATAAIETLLRGDGTHAPDPSATFLWITDQPELNEQTRRKMLDSSSVLGPSDLAVVDAAFDQETFTPGVVYFLNIQKLGREKFLVTPGDDRTYTIWETITKTIADRPHNFYVFIDEAHRGMAEKGTSQKDASTIVQKFIKGSPGQILPVPLIVGISATPERFNKLVEGTGRTARPVTIEAEAVRDSGLLKDVIRLYFPNEDQDSDITMLREAARSWKRFSANWGEYTASEGEPPVRPVLVVQVQDGSGKQISKTDIAEVIRVIDEEAGPAPPEAFAHAFQEGTRLDAGGRPLRYLAPSEIDADPDVQFVLFKTSLNTGWDCPRAEVMMSFRTAVDATLIAQLVGRMVRTPLARRVDSDEFLNTVSLYLPHYDEGGLAKVVSRLSAADPENLPPVNVERGDEVITLKRAAGAGDAFVALSELPSYIVPKSRKTSEVQRLMKLARLLANDEINEDASESATNLLLGVLDSEYKKACGTKRFQTVVEEKGKLEVKAADWVYGLGLKDDRETIEIDIADENVEDLFDAAGKKLKEGLHKAWWKARVAADPTAKTRARLELFALCSDGDVIRSVEGAAQKQVQTLLGDHRAAIKVLPEGRRQAYDEVSRLAADPEITPLEYPETIEWKKTEWTWSKHLYTGPSGSFPAKFNRWETAVIEPEIASDEVVGWLRNPDRKGWSLCIPYKLGGEHKPLYPDFLVVRRKGGSLVVDLLDPHSIDLADAPAKAAGLAQYADKHWNRYGRIELIILDGDEIKRLDLTDERTRDKVKGVQTHEHLRQLFQWG